MPEKLEGINIASPAQFLLQQIFQESKASVLMLSEDKELMS